MSKSRPEVVAALGALMLSLICCLCIVRYGLIKGVRCSGSPRMLQAPSSDPLARFATAGMCADGAPQPEDDQRDIDDYNGHNDNVTG